MIISISDTVRYINLHELKVMTKIIYLDYKNDFSPPPPPPPPFSKR